LVLNEDTLLALDCFTRLMEVGESDARIGIIGPMVYHADEPQVIQSAGGVLDAHWSAVHRGQNELDAGQYAQPQRVDWISGCAIMVRRAAIAQAGVLDERFFYYWEETEWCVRIRSHGWTIMHVPAAKLWHKGVQRNYRPGPAVSYYNTRNRFLLMAKHHAPLSVKLYNWWQIARTLSSWTLKPKWREQRGHRDAMWQGALDYWRGRWGKMPAK
jgi:GT2 family glycosyltransferase